ncbi:DUF420 domain-containing protein [Mangrovimonas futianensis]|uniref:DUF420 domain-containing protein n=1 Tax=Mangrovimonas futianensis TaxID=2895523 RepID=UPI001E4582AD|nr:DUF420 domain-containing protein [Mangrovimonas futianensis]MCF1421630.1 DUF420 domain-containing protein [Mangrovimonas futianensis]
MSNQPLEEQKKYNKWIVLLSIAIPVVVAVLFRVRIPNMGPWMFLPPIYASTNAITAILLIFAYWAIIQNKIKLHETLIKIAMGFSIAFLVMYVAYHMTSDPTPYGEDGVLKYFYYVILITHILLSVVVIPFVLITYVRAITNDIERHKKIAKITFPLWLYVAVSGVMVYVLISPFY